MRSFGWGTLAQQYQVLGKRFLQRFPNDWLVWEPGKWSVPRGTSGAHTTLDPDATGPRGELKQLEPLCFQLTETCRIGRAEGNDLVLSDETVSRRHCELDRRDGVWWLTRHADSRRLEVDGTEVKPGLPMQLVSGQRIHLGQLVFTFTTAERLVERFGRAR